MLSAACGWLVYFGAGCAGMGVYGRRWVGLLEDRFGKFEVAVIQRPLPCDKSMAGQSARHLYGSISSQSKTSNQWSLTVLLACRRRGKP